MSAGYQKFDVRKLERLNDPGRLESLRPEVMWSALGSPAPSTIVEIGAGTGMFAVEFARLAPSATVYATDIEQVMIDWMRQNRTEVASGRVIPVLGTEDGVPLTDGIADLVVMVNLHHELARPESIYAEAARLTRLGGQALVVDWAPFETPKGPPLEIRATPEDIADCLAAAGFSRARAHAGALPWHSLLTAER